MVEKEHSIYLQKMREGSPLKDSLKDFGIICTDFPFKLGGEVKDLPKRDWPGEDGEDVYFPSKMPLKAYDLEAEMCFKGDGGMAYDKIKAFLDYLSGESSDGTAMKIYNPFTGIGRQNVVYQDCDDFQFHSTPREDIVPFKVKFRVTDPRTRIIPVTNENQEITSLA